MLQSYYCQDKGESGGDTPDGSIQDGGSNIWTDVPASDGDVKEVDESEIDYTQVEMD